MILHNLNIINQGINSIKIDCEKISAIYEGTDGQDEPDETHLYFDNCIAFPGLINSHDHLDFNLFPQLGNSIYKSYFDWGPDIHQQNKAVIAQVLKIPKPLRARWGAYKNLLNGITTVVQHGEKLDVNNAPVNIFNDCHSLHSVGLEKWWMYKLNNPFAAKYPYVIHIGEGTDENSFQEISQLLNRNLFKRKLIGIHGVAMNREQAREFEALIWCPASNFFLLGKTAAINELKTATKILFGTDSTVSANWSIWHQLREARATRLLTDEELMAAVSSSPAEVWNLNNTGKIKEGYNADIVIAKKQEQTINDADAYFSCNPEDIQLILNKGRVTLFDAELLSQLTAINPAEYSKIYITNQCKYVIGDLPALVKEIKMYVPEINLPIETE